MLYEVAMVRKPSPKQVEEGILETLIMPPTPVVAKDDRLAAMAAMQKVGTEVKDFTNVEVIVRPFVNRS